MCFGYGFWACDEPETTRNICPLFDSATYAPLLYSCESSSCLCEFCSFNHPSRAAPPGLHLRTNPTRMSATNATTAESRWQKEKDQRPVEVPGSQGKIDSFEDVLHLFIVHLVWAVTC